MGNRTNYGTGRMTVDNRQKNERSRSGNLYSSHVKAGKHAGTVYNFKRKSRIRKSLTRLPILLEFIHKYIFLNFVSFYNGLNSNKFLLNFSVKFFQNFPLTGPGAAPRHSPPKAASRLSEFCRAAYFPRAYPPPRPSVFSFHRLASPAHKITSSFSPKSF